MSPTSGVVSWPRSYKCEEARSFCRLATATKPVGGLRRTVHRETFELCRSTAVQHRLFEVSGRFGELRASVRHQSTASRALRRFVAGGAPARASCRPDGDSTRHHPICLITSYRIERPPKPLRSSIRGSCVAHQREPEFSYVVGKRVPQSQRLKPRYRQGHRRPQPDRDFRSSEAASRPCRVSDRAGGTARSRVHGRSACTVSTEPAPVL